MLSINNNIQNSSKNDSNVAAIFQLSPFNLTVNISNYYDVMGNNASFTLVFVKTSENCFMCLIGADRSKHSLYCMELILQV